MDIARATSERAHKVHHAVYHAPGQVAAQYGDQGHAHILLAGIGNGYGAQNGHGHDEAKENFRCPVNWVENVSEALEVFHVF